LDRASGYEPEGYRFESYRAYHLFEVFMSDWVNLGLAIPFNLFKEQGLAKAGTMIKITADMAKQLGTSEELLIGDLNELGGLCDDCNIGRDTLVVAYKVLEL
jgi:hypothetical protein